MARRTIVEIAAGIRTKLAMGGVFDPHPGTAVGELIDAIASEMWEQEQKIESLVDELHNLGQTAAELVPIVKGLHVPLSHPPPTVQVVKVGGGAYTREETIEIEKYMNSGARPVGVSVCGPVVPKTDKEKLALIVEKLALGASLTPDETDLVNGRMTPRSELEEFIEDQAAIAEEDSKSRKDKRKFTAPWRMEDGS